MKGHTRKKHGMMSKNNRAFLLLATGICLISLCGILILKFGKNTQIPSYSNNTQKLTVLQNPTISEPSLTVTTIVSVTPTPQITHQERMIAWSLTRRLTFSDFVGIPPVDPVSNALSAINSNMDVEYEEPTCRQINNALWECQVVITRVPFQNIFDTSESWILDGKRSSRILNHEQRHFDLNEVFIRRKRNATAYIIGQTLHGQGENQNGALLSLAKTIQSNIKSAIAEVDNESTATQKRYDDETSHGVNEEKQSQWNQTIDEWLRQ
jgi:hypothetical protein